MTPEAKLLELIKYPSSEMKARQKRVLDSGWRLVRRGLAFSARWSPYQKLNGLLIFGSVAMLLFALQGWFHVNSRGSLAPVAPHSAGSSKETTSLPETKISDLTSRNLFRPIISAPPPVIVKVAPPPLPPPVPKVPLSQKASRFRLVGIIHGASSQAVIEDAQTQKSIYVTAGQMIGDIQVEKVLSDHVVLSSGDERMDLTE